MSSFQGVGIEGFHCIQRCLHFQGVGLEDILILLVGPGRRLVLMTKGRRNEEDKVVVRRRKKEGKEQSMYTYVSNS